MSTQPEISQRDLRLRSREIMDSVERGQSFTVTRDGHRIGHLVPLEHRHTFLPREEFTSGWHGPAADPDWLQADVDELIDNDVHDPYDR